MTEPIIPQSYPLWVIVSHGDGRVTAEPVVAWRVIQPPDSRVVGMVPIGPSFAELDLSTAGPYLTSQAAVDSFLSDYKRAQQ